jgi:hypothetical protein
MQYRTAGVCTPSWRGELACHVACVSGSIQCVRFSAFPMLSHLPGRLPYTPSPCSCAAGSLLAGHRVGALPAGKRFALVVLVARAIGVCGNRRLKASAHTAHVALSEFGLCRRSWSNARDRAHVCAGRSRRRVAGMAALRDITETNLPRGSSDRCLVPRLWHGWLNLCPHCLK